MPSLCRTPNLAIPDNNATGVTDTLIVGTSGSLSDVNASVQINHTWVGDLIVTLTHVDTSKSAIIIDRPGRTVSGFGCSGDNINATLDDQASTPVENVCGSGSPAIQGTFGPNNPLSVFNGDSIAGTWRLKVVDAEAGDVGTLLQWCLVPTTGG
jgi:subtilisin-like proprotein convertase family protein